MANAFAPSVNVRNVNAPVANKQMPPSRCRLPGGTERDIHHKRRAAMK